ncbi:5-(carboxyamino)imidazole ribonucleotide synthase [Oleispirillum naphthae]|uniref:5-(carboxyamino)imidazole ribonucleotide synthase n=1 Tax=Oleispirillum naphthae TaxID=2838853 RepID=UPI003082664F
MTQTSSPAIAPGSTIGILGGGQLGRMTALAAARLGYRCHVYCPEAGSPAFAVAAAVTQAPYDDAAALDAFAAAVDVVTFEFENIPAASVERLAARTVVRPSWKVLETAQDRALEKAFFSGIGAPTAPWKPVDGLPQLTEAIAALGVPCILKTRRLGYDGKGQARINHPGEAAAAWAAIAGAPAILEGYVAFSREISAIVARSPRGEVNTFDIAENVHVDHILDTTRIPAQITPEQAERAAAIAHHAAVSLDLQGLLAIEMFVADDGRILVNEMAPRPHNSGHWTIDACITDQFEQFVRAVCNLRLGSTERHSNAEMKNLLGRSIENWDSILSDPKAKLHLYGKTEAREGRKMGHVTRVFPRWKNDGK